MKITWKDVYSEVKRKLPEYLEETSKHDKSSNKWTCGICGSGTHDRADSTPALQLNEAKPGQDPTCHCYACGFHGTLIDYYCSCRKINVNDREATKAATIELATKYNIQTPPVWVSTRYHVYHDPNGDILSRKRISKDADGKKYPCWQLYHPETERFQGKPGTMKFLYDVHKIVNSTGTVFFAEGEKDAETVQNMGFIGTSTPNGAMQTKWLDTFEIGLKDRDIIVLTDNDKAGEKYIGLITRNLANVANSLKVIRPTDIYKDCKPKWDISDISDAIGIEAAKNALVSAIDAAPNYEPPTETEETPQLSTDASKYSYNEKWDGETLNEENFRRYLVSKGYEVKFNTLSRKVNYFGIDGIATQHLENSFPIIAYNDLHRELQRVNPKICGSFINLIANKNEFNPVRDLIQGATWDGKNHLETVYTVLNIGKDDSLSRTFMRKWLMQAYCLQFNTLEEPISSEFVLCLHGEQGIGKTSFLRKIAIKPEFFKEGATLDPSNKDSVMEALSYFITELGEVKSTIKRDRDILKAFLTNESDEFRRPYAPAAERSPRHTAFAASTNDERFLADDTGNRRWGVIPLESIDSTAIQRMTQADALQIWAQVKHMVDTAIQNGESLAGCFRLTVEERKAQELRNKRFLNLATAQMEVEDILANVSENPSEYEWKEETVTEWKAWYSCLDRYSVEKISHALTAAGIDPPTKPTKRDGKTVKLRKLPFPKRKPGVQSIEMTAPKRQVHK